MKAKPKAPEKGPIEVAKEAASLFTGMAELLTKKRTADCLAKWKRRDDYSRN